MISFLSRAGLAIRGRCLYVCVEGIIKLAIGHFPKTVGSEMLEQLQQRLFDRYKQSEVTWQSHFGQCNSSIAGIQCSCMTIT